VRITKRIEFDAGHRVPLHTSKCRNPHGHRYVVELEIDGDVPVDGMVLDYGIMKQALMARVHDRFDHSMILQNVDVDLIDFLDDRGWSVQILDCAPTAENLARIIGEDLATVMPVDVTACTVWETPSSSARWEPTR
jgi:6-pyruvoyltetrahydropterin/6-carboxytetrahydropterin synthase